MPACRQLYRPGGTSHLALPVLAANRLDPSDPQVIPSVSLMKRSAKVPPALARLVRLEEAVKGRSEAPEGDPETSPST